MTTELLEKYLQHLCTPEEQTEVESWLLQCKPAELDEVLVKIWNDADGTAMPEELENLLINQLPGHTQKKTKVMPFKWWQAAAAAVLTGIFFLVNNQLTTTDQTRQPVVAALAPQKTADADSVISNSSINVQQVKLPDGSTVTLYPRSAVRYPAAYNLKERNITLTGKAVFAVAKDKHRPFTVYAQGVATTALGTQFLVDAAAPSCVQVKLYEGRIMVRANSDQHILNPGDSLVYSDAEGSVLMKRKEKSNRAAQHSSNKNTPADTLHFLQTPLEEVFTTLAKEYGTIIQFNNNDLKGMNFTGEVSTGTSLSKLIRFIAEMNGLHCQNSPKGYTIRSK